MFVINSSTDRDIFEYMQYSFSLYLTGIIPFSHLGVFYANLGSAEIFFANRKRGPQTKWQINILKHMSVRNVGIVDILTGISVSKCK